MKVYCNCCGKEIKGKETKDGVRIALEDHITIEKVWGYFSEKDGICQKMNICESCFDDWVKGFVLAPEETEEQELL